MAGFYAARDNTMPPLPWPSIAAGVTLAKADIEYVLKAGFIIREPLEEIADAEVWGC